MNRSFGMCVIKIERMGQRAVNEGRCCGCIILGVAKNAAIAVCQAKLVDTRE